jgi:hypothetical protein
MTQASTQAAWVILFIWENQSDWNKYAPYKEFAIPANKVEDIKVLSLSTENLTVSLVVTCSCG